MNVPIIIDDIRVRGIGKSFDNLGPSVYSEASTLTFQSVDRASTKDGKCSEEASVYFEDAGRIDVPVFLLERLIAGDLVDGPAIILGESRILWKTLSSNSLWSSLTDNSIFC